MKDITEGSIKFSFPDSYKVRKYDKWVFYCKYFQSVANSKAVDILCIPNDTTWLIEIKDYSEHKRENLLKSRTR